MPVEEPTRNGTMSPIDGSSLSEFVEAQWGLRIVSPIQLGKEAELFICTSRTGSQVVLKRSFNREQIAREGQALRMWGALPGIVRVVEDSAANGLLVLEYIVSESPSSAHKQASVLAAFARLFEAEPLAADFPPLNHRVISALEETRSKINQSVNRTHPRLVDLLRQSKQRMQEMEPLSGPEVIVHGDLQQQNVLVPLGGAPEEPVIIDPKPHIGDPHFDSIDYMLADIQDIGEFRHRTHILRKRLPSVDITRVINWCVIAAPIIAARRLRIGPQDRSARFLLEFASGVKSEF